MAFLLGGLCYHFLQSANREPAEQTVASESAKTPAAAEDKDANQEIVSEKETNSESELALGKILMGDSLEKVHQIKEEADELGLDRREVFKEIME